MAISQIQTDRLNQMASDPALPKNSAFLFGWFRWYAERYIRRFFHAMRISKSSFPLPAETGESILFVINHPSWWDLLIGLVMCGKFKSYRHYVPMDSAILPQYRFLERIGAFGVDTTPRGVARFLRTSQAIFARSHGSLWITAQGHFADPRVRPLALRPGDGLIASRLSAGLIIPIALEYPFWNERTPEALILTGKPISIAEHPNLDRDQWTQKIEAALTSCMDTLAEEAISRDPEHFEILIAGKVGVGGVYDLWRQFKAMLRGKKFDPHHQR